MLPSARAAPWNVNYYINDKCFHDTNFKTTHTYNDRCKGYATYSYQDDIQIVNKTYMGLLPFI